MKEYFEMKKKHALIFILTALLTASCTKGGSDKKDMDLSTYPIETDVELTYFMPLN